MRICFRVLCQPLCVHYATVQSWKIYTPTAIPLLRLKLYAPVLPAATSVSPLLDMATSHDDYDPVCINNDKQHSVNAWIPVRTSGLSGGVNFGRTHNGHADTSSWEAFPVKHDIVGAKKV